MKQRSENRVDTEGSRIRGMFADISRRYDLLNRLLSLGTDVSWRRKSLACLDLPPRPRVLDVCTGTADLALEACRKLRGRNALVVGTDFTPEMLRIGRRKFRRLGKGTPRPFLATADTLRLPFAGGSFDAVTAAFGVRNLADLRGGLREMLRVLKPGGQVAILEFSLPRSRLLRKAYKVYFHGLLPRIGGLVSGSRAGREAYSYLPRSVAAFPPPEGLCRLLEECGFRNARHTPFTFGIVSLHLASRPAGGIAAPDRAEREAAFP